MIAFVITGYATASLYTDFQKEVNRLTTEVKLSQEETKRFALVLDQSREIAVESALAFIKAAKGAKSVSYGGQTFDETDIIAAQKRAPKTYIDWKITRGSCSVVALDCSRKGILITSLIDLANGEILKATYITDDEENEDAINLKFVLANAMATSHPVKLELNIGRKSGHIEKSTILNIIE